MRKIALLFVLAVVVGLFAFPLTAQEELPEFIQHTECEVDLTGETVTIYHFGDISGSYAFITQPLLAGLGDAATYFNERGGICGATIAQDNRDTGGDLGQTQAHYDYYSTLDPKPDLLVLYASGDAELLRTQVAEDEIPVIISAGSLEGLYGESGDEPGWIYATNPLYADQFADFCEFVGADPMDMYPDEPTIGYISWPGAFGEAAYTPETIAYCAEQGVTVLDTPEYFLPTAADISGNVLNLVDAGANILYTNSLASGPAAVARTVVELGLENEVMVAGVNWALDTSVGLLSSGQTLNEDGLPAVNGLVGSLPFRWWTEVDQPGIQLIREQATANERSLPTQNIAYLLGWSLVDYYIELYIQAVNEAGSLDAVDGAVMKNLIENVVYSPLGLYDIDFQGGEIRALPSNRMAMLAFANQDMSGPATSGDDALRVDTPNGQIFVPIVVPLADFEPAPDMRPGAGE
ncbi:MAG: ABC transporter substrate-binding protein [bacterium]|nr:ABC transporter substrate-binding protein [bacterium]